MKIPKEKRRAIFVLSSITLISLIFIISIGVRAHKNLTKSEFLSLYIKQAPERFCIYQGFSKFGECVDFTMQQCLSTIKIYADKCVHDTEEQLPSHMNYAQYESAQISYKKILDFCVGRESFLEISNNLPHEKLSCMWGISQDLQGF